MRKNLAIGALLFIAVVAIIFQLLTGTKPQKRMGLEAEIPTALPLGSPIAVVAQFLAQHHIEHTLQSKSIQAIARNVGPQSFLIQRSLSLTFQFDDDSKLRRLDNKEKFTGP